MSSLISVIIPIYNAAPYLERCLSSILSQSYLHFECILIDDGSSDGSSEICQRFAASNTRFRYFRKENGGEASARNMGLAQAQGEYICWVDADDYVVPHYLADLIEAMDTDTDLVIESVIRKTNAHECQVSGVGVGVYDLSEQDQQQLFFSSVNLDHFGVSFSKIFRRSIINDFALRYSSDILLAVDLDFLFRYLAHCRKVVVRDCANYYYMLRSGSVSTTIYSMDTEHRGMCRIAASGEFLRQVFPLSVVSCLVGVTVADYQHRVLIACYKPAVTRAQRLSYFRSVSDAALAQYRQYGPRQTRLLRMMNSLFSHRRYFLFDGLMLLVYRYRYPLS